MGIRKVSCWRLSCWCNEVGPEGCPRPQLIETEEAPDGEDAPIPSYPDWVATCRWVSPCAEARPAYRFTWCAGCSGSPPEEAPCP